MIGDTPAVIAKAKFRESVINPENDLYYACLSVTCRVFQQILHYLLNQLGVHQNFRRLVGSVKEVAELVIVLSAGTAISFIVGRNKSALKCAKEDTARQIPVTAIFFMLVLKVCGFGIVCSFIGNRYELENCSKVHLLTLYHFFL